MKTKMVIVAAVLVLSALVLTLFYARSKTPPPLPATTLVAPPTVHPSTMPQPISSGPIIYSGEPTASFPKSVPYFRISRHRDFETERSRLFALYNITSPPETIIGSRGRYASFTKQKETGTISENPLTFAFHTMTQTAAFVTNDKYKYLSATHDALTELSVLPSGFSPTLINQIFLSFDEPHPTELSGPERALVTKLDFVASISGLPVYVNDADTPVFSSSFNGNDELIEIRGYILPDVSKEDQDIAIISYASAVEKLKKNMGVFSSVSLSSSGDKEFMTGDLPDTIQIKNVTLGYLYSRYQDYLVPVFVFTGEANEPGERSMLRTTTVVSAL